MNIVLQPGFEKYIEELVRAGRYTSVEGVLEDALDRLMHDDVGEEIDDEIYAALVRSEAQVRGGEGMSVVEAREHFRRRALEVKPPENVGGR